MLFSEVLDHLHFGELSQLFMGNNKSSSIAVEDYPRIISFINLALVELYKRFSLSQKNVIIKTDTTINDYFLKTDFALSNTGSPEPIKYIQDSVSNPFLGDILIIDRVVDSDLVDIPLRVIGDNTSLYTPSYDSLHVPTPVQDAELKVWYRAKPQKLSLDISDPIGVEIPIPELLLEPLLNYIAHRAYLSKDTPQVSKSSKSYSNYLAACLHVDYLGLLPRESTLNTKLDASGFE